MLCSWNRQSFEKHNIPNRALLKGIVSKVGFSLIKILFREREEQVTSFHLWHGSAIQTVKKKCTEHGHW
jgi:hypothetical protein